MQLEEEREVVDEVVRMRVDRADGVGWWKKVRAPTSTSGRSRRRAAGEWWSDSLSGLWSSA